MAVCAFALDYQALRLDSVKVVTRFL